MHRRIVGGGSQGAAQIAPIGHGLTVPAASRADARMMRHFLAAVAALLLMSPGWAAPKMNEAVRPATPEEMKWIEDWRARSKALWEKTFNCNYVRTKISADALLLPEGWNDKSDDEKKQYAASRFGLELLPDGTLQRTQRIEVALVADGPFVSEETTEEVQADDTTSGTIVRVVQVRFDGKSVRRRETDKHRDTGAVLNVKELTKDFEGTQMQYGSDPRKLWFAGTDSLEKSTEYFLMKTDDGAEHVVLAGASLRNAGNIEKPYAVLYYIDPKDGSVDQVSGYTLREGELADPISTVSFTYFDDPQMPVPRRVVRSIYNHGPKQPPTTDRVELSLFQFAKIPDDATRTSLFGPIPPPHDVGQSHIVIGNDGKATVLVKDGQEIIPLAE